MQRSSHLGFKNRTGMQISPQHSKELLETVDGLEGAPAPSDGDDMDIAEERIEIISISDPIGTIPAPTTLKGMAKSGAKMIKGEKPQVLLDKLAERSAFERSGTRLYDALIAKFRAETGSDRNGALPKDVSDGKLLEIRNEEAAHFALLTECIEQLGGDPTTQTPSADLVGVESMGLLQAVSDPRTSFVQSLHAVLAAELIDRAGWDLLCEMAESMGHKEMAGKFRAAFEEEEEHLRCVQSWYSGMTLREGT